MKRLLLDTTFLIDTERAEAAAKLIDDDDDVAMAAITVAELLVGVELSKCKARIARQTFVDSALTTIPIISYDVEIARTHAGLLAAVRKAGRPLCAHDLLIAATAKVTGRTVVTADPDGFENLPGVDVSSHR
ncbi:MAG: PIN domain-containing protein [Acidimicrobiia bacterium]|nr:PIN domain-containing protein [Acidimicrobiia bacterium]